MCKLFSACEDRIAWTVQTRTQTASLQTEQLISLSAGSQVQFSPRLDSHSADSVFPLSTHPLCLLQSTVVLVQLSQANLSFSLISFFIFPSVTACVTGTSWLSRFWLWGLFPCLWNCLVLTCGLNLLIALEMSCWWTNSNNVCENAFLYVCFCGWTLVKTSIATAFWLELKTLWFSHNNTIGFSPLSLEVWSSVT